MGVAVVVAAGAAGAAVVTALLDPQLARVKRRPQPKAEALRIFIVKSVEARRELMWAGRREFHNCFANGVTKHRRCEFGRSPPYDAGVSTRKLILTAIACGLAILIAGGFFLVRTLGNKDALTVKNAAVGDSRTVARAEVRVTAWRRDSAQILATVSMKVTDVDARTSTAESPWTMLIGTQSSPVAPIGLTPNEKPCRGINLTQGNPVTCVLAFPDAKGTPYLAFSLEGQQAQWLLAA